MIVVDGEVVRRTFAQEYPQRVDATHVHNALHTGAGGRREHELGTQGVDPHDVFRGAHVCCVDGRERCIWRYIDGCKVDNGVAPLDRRTQCRAIQDIMASHTVEADHSVSLLTKLCSDDLSDHAAIACDQYAHLVLLRLSQHPQGGLILQLMC